MTPVNTMARDHYERLAWRLSGVLVASLFVIWLAGLLTHRSATDEVPNRTPTEFVRADATRPTATRFIRFAEVGRDFVALDATDGTSIRALGFERDGFVVSIVRSLERERRRLGIATGAPYRLIRWNNGQLLFEDPETGGQIELTAFGASNAEAFGQLLAVDGGKAQR